VSAACLRGDSLGNLLASEALASIRTNVRKVRKSETGDLPIRR